jgi:hypothetical protein
LFIVVTLLVIVVSLVVMVLPMIRATPANTAIGFGFLFVVVGGAAAFLLYPIRRWRSIRPWRRWFRLTEFARDNGLLYVPETAKVPSGLMFGQGEHRRLVDTFEAPNGSFTMGTFTFVADGSSVVRDRSYTFLRIALQRPVPHLVLVSVARRGVRGYSSVGLALAETQRVRLEGDFDRYFAVYAPDGYGADVRYVLTPDFMVRLIDNAKDFDLEFVDDQLYVYSAAVWDAEHPATWTWARSFLEIVGAAALRRTGRFADDRSSAPGHTVAPQGRRLKVAVPLVAALIAVGWVAFLIIRVIVQASN